MRHVHLAVVHKVQNVLEVGGPHAAKVDQGVLMGVALQQSTEKRAARAEYNFVCAHLLVVLAHQGYVQEVVRLTNLDERLLFLWKYR